MNAYLPILVADRSRLDGLAAATDEVKARLTPLFEVPAHECGARDAPSRAALEARLVALLDGIAAAFGERRALLDATAGGAHRAADGRVYAAWLLDAARARGLSLVPVTGLCRSAAHQLAVADAASTDGRGACIRLQLPDFANIDTLPGRVHALADVLAVGPERLDLIVDFGAVGVEQLPVLTVAARAVLSPLRRAARWRSLTLAASQPLPRPAAAGAPAAVPRTEWLLWSTLVGESARPGEPGDPSALRFGDYAGPGDRLPAADDGRTAAGSPADGWLGYARETEWIVVQTGDAAGDPVWTAERGPGGEADGDATAALVTLPDRPEFYGPLHCAGDARLAAGAADEYARVAVRPAASLATLASWRSAAVTHHLTVTVEQLLRRERVGW